MELGDQLKWSFADLWKMFKPQQEPIPKHPWFKEQGTNHPANPNDIMPYIPDEDLERHKANPFKYWEDEWAKEEEIIQREFERLIERRKHDDKVIDQYKSPHLFNYPTMPLDGDRLMYEWMQRNLAPPLHDMDHRDYFRRMRRINRDTDREQGV